MSNNKPRVSISGSISSFFGGKKNVKRDREATFEEKVLQAKTDQEEVTKEEKERIAEFQRKQDAARTIQKAWRKHRRTRQTSPAKIIAKADRGTRKPKCLEKRPDGVDTAECHRQEKIFAESAQKAVRLRRIQATQAEWEKQIAALTIQLAWRKFYRRKLLKSLNPNRRQLHMWDPQIVALKQQALIGQIYGEELMAPFWHPTLKPAVRPFWLHLIPSPAAVSYNFAVDQYHPYKSWQGMQPHAWNGTLDGPLPFDFGPYASSSLRPERSQTTLFSLNVKKVGL